MKRVVLIFFFTMALLAGCAAPEPVVDLPTPQMTEPAVTQPADTPALRPTDPPASPTLAATAEPTQPAQPFGWIAFIGSDENLWLVDPVTGEQQQLTQDATPTQPEPGTATVRYCCAEWSSDGRLLAYQREMGTPVTEGAQYEFSLWVYDIDSGSAGLVLENQMTAGFAWRPGTHVLTYGLSIPGEYFTTRGSPAPEYAQGIWAVDADRGVPFELVPPERGLALVAPQWSRDGRFISFDEVLYMEGRGYFAYYDMEAQEYTSWEKAIGMYDWSEDSERIAYDTLTYTASGTERIYLNNRQGTEEQAFSPEYEQGYAFSPVFAPQNDRLAFLAELHGPDSSQYTLFVQMLDGGEPRALGVFEQVMELAWSQDGERLVLSTGPYENRQIVVVRVANGAIQVLAGGYQPAWQPASP